jgi:folate-binding protein YgfZ
MGLTALQTQHPGLGSAQGDYRGATAAARFDSPERELAALRNSCGVYDLGYRAKISLTGADRVRWLNGMVTNNIRDLAPERGVYAFLLNPQGHILGDLYAYNRGDSIIVDTDHSQVEKILATFDHYIIMDDVEVANLSDSLTALSIAGPKSPEVLASCGIEVRDLQPLQVFDTALEGTPCTIVRGEDLEYPSYELWMPSGDVHKFWAALVAHGATPAGSEALEWRRILSGIPLYGVDIRERDLPQETEQTRALNFSKGCYIGQEIVERIRSRGAVHRKFAAFRAPGPQPIAPGSKIVVNEKEVGEITSAAVLHIADEEKTVALGYVRREIGTPGREVLIGSVRATVIATPVTDLVLLGTEPALEHHEA